MKPKFGKYYLLRTNKYYHSIDLQRDVMFKDKVVVKCGSSFGIGGYFGYLVDTSELYNDMETKNEIVFSEEDVISEYQLSGMPLMYTDFIFKS